MLALGQIIRKYNIYPHFYADDTQTYLSIDPPDLSALNILSSCLMDIKVRMSDKYLLLHNNKTEVFGFGSQSS